MSAVASQNHQRLSDSLALKALIAAVICVVVIPAGPLALVLGVISFARERHPVTAGIAVILGALETLVLVLVFLVPNGCGPTSRMYEVSAGTSLKSGIFPAMVQFQGEPFRDEDGDGVGEHGFPEEMGGGPDGRATANRPALLPPNFAAVHPLIEQYHFVVYLPDGSGATTKRTAITDHSPAAIDARERHWIAYAWPAPATQGNVTGTLVFCIDERGYLWCTPAAKEASAPRWDAALSKGWGSDPAPGWERWKK
jgi:hypothetical protein